MNHANEVVTFWFEEIEPAQWWRKHLAFDAEIRRRFGALHDTATATGLAHWHSHIEGRLAEIIVLDQFSRNLFRNEPRAFAMDTVAVRLAKDAIALGLDVELAPVKRAFLYMPFMHSESMAHQRTSVKLFEEIKETGNLRSAQRHFDVIERFGRFPHRNKILKRHSSREEEVFLQEPRSTF